MPVFQSSLNGTLIRSATGFDSFFASSADDSAVADPDSSAAANCTGNAAASAAATMKAVRLFFIPGFPLGWLTGCGDPAGDLRMTRSHAAASAAASLDDDRAARGRTFAH